MLNAILFPILVVGGLGVLFGIILGIAAIKFRVERDPKIDSIREALPGANCGGCGFAGCDALAEAIAAGKAPVNGCPVGGAKSAAAIGEIMGVKADTSAKKTAFVKCNGTCDKAKNKFEYYGAPDCVYEKWY